MGFLPELEPTIPDSPSPTDYIFAEQLKSALGIKGLAKHWSRNNWAQSFKCLRNELNNDIDRIETVLDWYCNHIGCSRNHVPWAHCAETFYKKFFRIEMSMDIDKENNPQHTTISPLAQKVATRLRKYQWPMGSSTQLESTCQVSLEEYHKFKSALEKAHGYTSLDPNLVRFISRTLQTHFGFVGADEEFVYRWLEDVFKRVVGWKKWSGNLLKEAFRIHSEKFQLVGRCWAEAYGDATCWDKVMELVNASPKA